MEIGLAGPADRDAVIALLGAQLAEHAIELPLVDLAHAVDGVIADPARGVLFVACVEDRAVGVAYLAFTWTLEHGGPVGWLEELYVEPPHRERGIGTMLLDAVCARARAEGCGAVDLEVDEAHARAAHLYMRRGFRRLMRTRFSLRLFAP